MKLFVDDIRPCPKGWIPARTVTEAIRILATQYVEEVSLDHDIQCYVKIPDIGFHASEETFEPVAYYINVINEMERFQKAEYGDCNSGKLIKVRIHTSNFAAGKKMADILGIKYTNYIYNPEDYGE